MWKSHWKSNCVCVPFVLKSSVPKEIQRVCAERKFCLFCKPLCELLGSPIQQGIHTPEKGGHRCLEMRVVVEVVEEEVKEEEEAGRKEDACPSIVHLVDIAIT